MKAKQIIVLLLALSVLLCCSVTAFAADSTTATVPVTLTVDNEYYAINVTVPASLPVYIKNGAVFTAKNARITNNSNVGIVQVTALSVTDGAYQVGSYENFSGQKTIAMKFNGCVTNGAGNVEINAAAFPRIAAGESMPLTYHVKVSGDAPNAEDVNAANVVFTISVVR